MMRVFAIIILTLAAVGCAEDPPEAMPEEPDPEILAPTEKGAEVQAATEEKEASQEEQEKGQLAEGTHAVYGLKMPRGMMPMKIPGDTQRFEGTHSLTVLRRYIGNQLENGGELKKDERGDFFLRGAKVKGSETGEVLAVRIFKGSLGGGSVDIWLDNSATLAAASKSGDRPTGTVKRRPAPPPSTYVKPSNSYERRKRTFNLMQKLERGEKIDNSELGDQFFY